MWNDGEREFDVDEDHAEEEDGEGEEGGECCEESDGDCEDEEEREDYAVDGVEKCHGFMLLTSVHYLEEVREGRREGLLCHGM